MSRRVHTTTQYISIRNRTQETLRDDYPDLDFYSNRFLA